MMIQYKNVMVNLSLLLFLLLVQGVITYKAYANYIQLTDKQARALQSLSTETQSESIKSLRLKVAVLKDNQGQEYLGALVSRVELLPYLTKLKQLIPEDFNQYRALQVARDQQKFHLTILSPKEYQLADKVIVDRLLTSDVNQYFSNQLNVTLFGLGKVRQDDKVSYFVVAQSADAQLIRQQFILPAKDFHITLAFNPSDIDNVKKDLSTLIDKPRSLPEIDHFK
jgi:hypothetical protein